MPNYTAHQAQFRGLASSLMIGLLAILAQWLVPQFPRQGLDLIDSFFIYALLSQFTHLGWAHLGLNLAGLALVHWGFSGQRSHPEWLWIQATSLVWTAFYLAQVEPLNWYCGLSGALHFQFAACLALAWARTPRPLANWPLCLLLIGLVAKLLIEWNTMETADAVIGGPIALQAHRGGALGGALAGVLLVMLSRRRAGERLA